MEGLPHVPRYTQYDTLIFTVLEEEIAWLPGVALWPVVGSIIELGNPDRDAIVTEVRLRLPQAPGEQGPGAATILVVVDDRGVEQSIP